MLTDGWTNGRKLCRPKSPMLKQVRQKGRYWTWKNVQVQLTFKTEILDNLNTHCTNTLFLGVSLANDAHGPALTMTIRPGNREHHISVDVTISVPTNHPVVLRDRIKKVFTWDQMQAAEDAGMHYVPKRTTAFDLSYSKVERALLKGIDGHEMPSGCRKRCHKVIKKYVQMFQQSRGDGAPGISSHIFKVWLPNMAKPFKIFFRSSNDIESLYTALSNHALPNYLLALGWGWHFHRNIKFNSLLLLYWLYGEMLLKRFFKNYLRYFIGFVYKTKCKQRYPILNWHFSLHYVSKSLI